MKRKKQASARRYPVFDQQHAASRRPIALDLPALGTTISSTRPTKRYCGSLRLQEIAHTCGGPNLVLHVVVSDELNDGCDLPHPPPRSPTCLLTSSSSTLTLWSCCMCLSGNSQACPDAAGMARLFCQMLWPLRHACKSFFTMRQTSSSPCVR